MSIMQCCDDAPRPIAHIVSRYRPTEYDTYRDPVGPISASAQVLFGAIANFVIGLADVPADMLVDLVSAGRALGHPHPRLDPLTKWHKRKSRLEEELANEAEDEREETRERETQYNQPGIRRDDLETEEDNEEEMLIEESENQSESVAASSDDRQTHLGSLPSQNGIDRRRSLQLEKSETMSSEVALSRSHNAIWEMVHYGSKVSKKFVNLVIWLPTDLSLSLSKGFHNAPKLYHDPMVQATPKVIGVRSGFRAAGKVFPDRHFWSHAFTDKISGAPRWLLLWNHRSRHSASLWL